MLSSAATAPRAHVEIEESVLTSSSSQPAPYLHTSLPSAAGPRGKGATTSLSDNDSFSRRLSSAMPMSGDSSIFSAPFPSSSFSASSFPPYSSSSSLHTRVKDMAGSAGGTHRNLSHTATATTEGSSHRSGGGPGERRRTKTGSSILLPSREKFHPAAGPLQYLQMRSAFLYTPSFVAPLPAVPLAPKLCAYTLKRSAICGVTSAADPNAAVAAAVHNRLQRNKYMNRSSSSSSNNMCMNNGDGCAPATGEQGRSREGIINTSSKAPAADVTIFDMAASKQLLQEFDAAGLLVNLINPKGYPQLLAIPPPPGPAGAIIKQGEENQLTPPGSSTGKSVMGYNAAGTTAAVSALPSPCMALLPPEDLDLVAGVLPECAAYLQQQQQQRQQQQRAARRRHGAHTHTVIDRNAQQRGMGAASAAAEHLDRSSSPREQLNAAVDGGLKVLQNGQAEDPHMLGTSREDLIRQSEKGGGLGSNALRGRSPSQTIPVYRHPTKPHLRPRRILTVVPCKQLCGNRYLQVGIDLPPNELDALAEDETTTSVATGRGAAGAIASPSYPTGEAQQQQSMEAKEQQHQQNQEEQQGRLTKVKKQRAPASLLLVNSSSLTYASYAYYMKIAGQEQPLKDSRQLLSPSRFPGSNLSEAKQHGSPRADESAYEVSGSTSNNKLSPATSPSLMEAKYRFARDYTCQLSRNDGSYRGEKTFLLIIPRSSSSSTTAACVSGLTSSTETSTWSATAAPPHGTLPNAAGASQGTTGTTARGKGSTEPSTGFAYVVPLHSHKRILMKAGGFTRRSKIRLLLRQPSEKEREAFAERRTACLGGSTSPYKAPQRSNAEVDEETLASAVTAAASGASHISPFAGGGGGEESSSVTAQTSEAANEKDFQEEVSEKKEEEELKTSRAGEDVATPSTRSRQHGKRKADGESSKKDNSALPSVSSSRKQKNNRVTVAGRRAGDRSHSSSSSSTTTVTTNISSAAAAIVSDEEEEPQLFREDNGGDKEDQENEEEEEEDEEEEDESSSSASGSSSSKSDEDDD